MRSFCYDRKGSNERVGYHKNMKQAIFDKLDFATFWARRPRDICSRGSYLNQEGVKNPFLV